MILVDLSRTIVLAARIAALPQRRARFERAPFRQRPRRLRGGALRPCPRARGLYPSRLRRRAVRCRPRPAGRRAPDAAKHRRADGPRPGGCGEGGRLAIAGVDPPVSLGRLRVRQAGPRQFMDVVITVPLGAAVSQGHEAADGVEEAVSTALPGSDVVVHVEPKEDDAVIRDRAHAAALGVPRFARYTTCSSLDVTGHTEVSLHLKLPGELTLEEAHEVANQVESAIAAAVPEVDPSRPTSSRSPRRRREGRWTTTAPSATSSPHRSGRHGLRSSGASLPAHGGRSARLPHARARSREPARRSPRPCERDRRAHPARPPRHRRRDRPHRAVRLCMFTPRDLELERGWPGIIEGDTSCRSPRRRCRRSSPAAARRGGTPSTRWRRSTSARRCSTRPRCATSTPSSNTSRPRAPSRTGGAARVVRAPGVLLLEPRGDLRPGRRDPVST